MTKKLWKMVFIVYLLSLATLYNALGMENDKGPGQGESDFGMTATDIGVMCISAAYPSMDIKLADSRDNEESNAENPIETVESEKESADTTGNNQVTGEPRVLIIHTHATESYLPSSQGNFHTKEETNTVRDVGNVLSQTLEDNGIGVIHNKTLHDDPSYNSSYSRSYQTAAEILKQYPTIECVIDLHRDATSAKTPSATISVKGKTCATYSFVIGQGASTYAQNKAFVSKLNQKAIAKYNGFTGNVIERGYKYNQDLSSKYILLEIGFNQNQIEDCRNTARIFGQILADTLKGE